MINSKYLKIIIFIALNLVAISCKEDEKEAEEERQEAKKQAETSAPTTLELTPDQIKMSGIELGKIEMKNLSSVLQVSGIIDVPPQNLVSVSVPAAGYLRKTDLLQGSPVRKGQVLAVIQNVDFIQIQQDFLQTRSDISENESQLEFLKAEYERQQDLAKENANAQKNLQSAKAQFFAMQAKIESLRAKLGGLRAKMQILGLNTEGVSSDKFQSEIKIISPINGAVTKVNANIGKFLNTTDVLFEIVDNDHQHAELTAFERDLPKIKVGQKVRFILANETRERTATVHLLGKEISPERTIRVHCHLDKEDVNILPNSYLKAVIEVGNHAVTALPSEAIVDMDGKNFIFISGEKAGEFDRVEVKKGVTSGSFTEVSLPIAVDAKTAQIVVKGTYSLLSLIKIGEGGDDD